MKKTLIYLLFIAIVGTTARAINPDLPDDLFTLYSISIPDSDKNVIVAERQYPRYKASDLYLYTTGTDSTIIDSRLLGLQVDDFRYPDFYLRDRHTAETPDLSLSSHTKIESMEDAPEGGIMATWITSIMANIFDYETTEYSQFILSRHIHTVLIHPDGKINILSVRPLPDDAQTLLRLFNAYRTDNDTPISDSSSLPCEILPSR